MLSLYEILKASKTGIAPDMWTALAGKNWGGAGSGVETKELTGVPPLSFRADGTPLLDYLISGNMSQTGTPPPDNPIQPQETGERTANLLPFDDKNFVITAGNSNLTVECKNGNLFFQGNAGEIGSSQVVWKNNFAFELEAGTYYCNSPAPLGQGFGRYIKKYDDNATILTSTNYTFTLSEKTKCYLSFYIYQKTIDTKIELMLNLGSEALPYEPYGYKLTISSGGNNLFDLSKYTGYSTGISDIVIDENGITYTAASPLLAIRYSFPLTENDSYVVSLGKESTSRLELRYFKDNAQVGNTIVVTSGNNARITGGIQYDSIRIYISNGSSTGVIVASNIMLNLGATALPYEPYIEPTETNIYLGESQTTRRVKKAVFDGNENWTYEDVYSRFWLYVADFTTLGLRLTPFVSNSFGSVSDGRPITDVPDNTIYSGAIGGIDGHKFYIKCTTYTSLNDWKSFLAAQYQNGTPVTVWYVLATPETAVVNEPIRKIGDYADTVSMEQAGVQIPTLHGNTIIDVLTELKPSEMYIKYKG